MLNSRNYAGNVTLLMWDQIESAVKGNKRILGVKDNVSCPGEG